MRYSLLALFLAIPVLSQSTPTVQGPSLDLGGGYSLSLPSLTQLETANTVALRDYYNGQWLLGYGHDVGYLNRNGTQIAYLDAWNAFNTDDGRGVFGLSAGVKIPAAIYEIADSVAGLDSSFNQSAPPWLVGVNKFLSFEVGAGDRLFGGGGPDTKRFAAVIGGKVSVPFGSLFNHTGSL